MQAYAGFTEFVNDRRIVAGTTNDSALMKHSDRWFIYGRVLHDSLTMDGLCRFMEVSYKALGVIKSLTGETGEEAGSSTNQPDRSWGQKENRMNRSNQMDG